MLTLAHEGAAAYRDRFELIYRHRAARPNQIWQADHTQLDVLILDASGKPVRPWLTMVMDDHSRGLSVTCLFSVRPRRCRPRSPCVKRSGARPIRTGPVMWPS